MITGAIAVKRRLPAAVHDGMLDRSTSLVLVGGLFVLCDPEQPQLAALRLYSYDTAQPWSTFVGTTALGFLEAVVFPLILVTLLYVLDALRRRVGIPMVPAGTWRSARTDVLIMGLGLGGVIYAATGLDVAHPAGWHATHAFD